MSEISNVEPGAYYFDRKLGRTSAAARDPDAPGRLWRESERILGDLYGPA